jgi:hypothetical protein
VRGPPLPIVAVRDHVLLALIACEIKRRESSIAQMQSTKRLDI